MFDVEPNSSQSRMTDSMNNKMTTLKEDIIGKQQRVSNKLETYKACSKYGYAVSASGAKRDRK